MRMSKWENLPPHLKQTQYADVREAIGSMSGEGDVAFDFARHVGLVYPRRAYQWARQRVESVHGKSFKSFVAESTASVPDYNLLGAVMYLSHRDVVKWIEVSGEDAEAGPTKTFPVLRHDSWSGLRVEEATRLECILRADVTWSGEGSDDGTGGVGRWTPDPFDNCPTFNLCTLAEYRGNPRRQCDEEGTSNAP